MKPTNGVRGVSESVNSANEEKASVFIKHVCQRLKRLSPGKETTYGGRVESLQEAEEKKRSFTSETDTVKQQIKYS